MKETIYVFTHKTFEEPTDPMYMPIHVGRAAYAGEDARLLSYLGDDTGDNISAENCYYSELTGMYWAWKNSTAEIIGTAHYRRYLLDPTRKDAIYTKEGILRDLEHYDVITTKELELNEPYIEGFASHHKISYFDETRRVIADLYPEYLEEFCQLSEEYRTYFGNMLICRRELFDDYCKWLFAILFELQSRIEIVEEDSYHRRIFGFISEFLQFVYIKHHGFLVRECMVGMLGEKAEVRETKEGVAPYLVVGDIEGAKRYLLEARKKRPDLMMEASDITGELHLCMEIIAIAEREQSVYGENILSHGYSYRDLMRYGNALNGAATRQLREEKQSDGESTEGRESPFLKLMTQSEQGDAIPYTKEAFAVALVVMEAAMQDVPS